MTPRQGAPTPVALDGQVRWAWWGRDAQDRDAVATRSGRVLLWPTQGACRHDAERSGCLFDPERASESLLDLRPAQDWLAGRALSLDARSALDLWNWALDVASSTGRPWNPHGRRADACYAELVATQTPFVVDAEHHQPRWSPRQLTAMRSLLGAAVHVLRTAGWA